MSLKLKRVVIVYVREWGEQPPRLVVVLFSVEPRRVKMWKASIVVLAALVAVAASVGMMVGAPQKIDVNDERVQNALNFAVGEHNKRSNDAFLRGVDEALEATRQVW